MSQPELK